MKIDKQKKLEKLQEKLRFLEQKLSKNNLILNADDFRVPREKLVLYASLLIVISGIFVLSITTFFLFIIVICISIIIVKSKQAQLLGQSIKVSEHNLPNVYNAAKVAAKRLSMKMPDVFVRFDPHINAFALGFFGKKSVVLNSKTVEAMSDNELIFILGHELSYVKCDHTNWIVVTGAAGNLKIPVISNVISFILLKWSRMAEFTADRGGGLACRDFNASVGALIKLAVGEKLCKEIEIDKMFGQQDYLGNFERLIEMFNGHPFIINRLHELKHFFISGIYSRYSQIWE